MKERRKIMLGAATIANVKANLRGAAVEPQDQDYDETRAFYNAMIDKRPPRLSTGRACHVCLRGQPGYCC